MQVFDYHDKASLAAAIEKQIALGIPQVSDPKYEGLIFETDGRPVGLKTPVEPKYAGVPEWDALERNSIYFSIQCYPSGYLVDCWGRGANDKWSEEQSLELRLLSSVGLSGLVDAIWSHLQARRDLPGMSFELPQSKTANGA